MHDRKWIKKGFIYKAQDVNNWWHSCIMAPAAFILNQNTIRILCGAWDQNNTSRIGFIDVERSNPLNVIRISGSPILDFGQPGCFDDSGVFPGHVSRIDDTIYLYYTGFQQLRHIPFTNFSGLAISTDNGLTFIRVGQAPVMDRSEEGLFTRAGVSIIRDQKGYKACYSAGSTWEHVEGKDRPVYEVFYQDVESPDHFLAEGRKIVPCNRELEHGLGRPQLLKLGENYYVFYTRRNVDFKYHMGVATSKDCIRWDRIDSWLADISLGQTNEFDSDMVYFPCVLEDDDRLLLFYSGNGFGKEGLGYAELGQ